MNKEELKKEIEELEGNDSLGSIVVKILNNQKIIYDKLKEKKKNDN